MPRFTPGTARAPLGGERAAAPLPFAHQAMPRVNVPGDAFEQEADGVAETVMGMSGPENAATTGTPATGASASGGDGAPMARPLRDFFEPRFGHDFSRVRVHTGESAARSARSVDALAYTSGADVVFGAGQYAPGTASGMRLMAHELAHVIQQGAAAPAAPGARSLSRAPGGMLQRQSDVRKLPKGMPCVTVTGPGHPSGGTSVEFTSMTTVSKAGETGIAAFHTTWTAAGAADPISIDGFASTPGDQTMNWQLSCDRAQTVKSRLVALGVPETKITTFAHGASTEFSKTTGAPNKLAVIHSGNRLSADDVKIDRVETKGADDAIFFDRESSKIPVGDQAGKIGKLAAPPDRKLTLFGFVSEDEAGGLTLAKARIAAVSKALGDQHHATDRTPDTATAITASAGQLDYRGMRRVDVKPTGAPPDGPDCSLGAVIPCSSPAVFTDAQAKADTLLDKAISALSPLKPADRPTFDAQFHSTNANRADTVAAVLSNLTDVRGHIKTQMTPVSTVSKPGAKPGPGHYCLNKCDGLCAAGASAYNNDVDAAASMGLCDTPKGFMQETDVDERASVLIHEGLHGIKIKTTTGPSAGGARDISYQHQRMMPFLDRANAVRNSDNYVALVRLFNGHAVTVGPTVPDAATGVAMSADERARVDRALAWLEAWIVDSSSQTSALYSVANDSVTSGAWTMPAYETMMGFIAPRFGLTPPPALPSADERTVLAAIAERFNRMFAVIFEASNVTIDRSASVNTAWSPGPGRTVTIGPDFFAVPAGSSNNRRRLDILLFAMVKATSGISSDAVTRYVDVADQMRLFMRRQDP